MLSPDQISQIKAQILKQIENFPEDKKELAKQQIESMNSEQLEQFLQQNKLIKQESSQDSQAQCIFCSIIAGNALSYKIEEDKNAIVVLEINPISKGHILIIPKEHKSFKDKIPEVFSEILEKITKKIKAKFKPKEIKIFPSNLFGHGIINVLPVYKDEDINSKRHSAKPEELEQLKKTFEKKGKEKIVKIIKKPKAKKIKEKLWLPRRIP